MKLTNKLGLPEAIVRAVKSDPYSAGKADYSVTTLLKPPRMVALERIHKDEIEQDVADRLWSLLGQLMHGVLERAALEGEIEQRHSATILGKVVSGAIDVYLDGIIQDYKLITAWKVVKGVPKEYEEQLNCYAYLQRIKGKPVSGLQLVCVLRDWSKLEAARNLEYPQSQVVLLEVNLWAEEAQLAFLQERVRLHEEAKENLPLCSTEERWATNDMYAVTKPGQKRALRLVSSLEEAQALAEPLKADIRFRPGESKRCGYYCPVAKFCDQWKKESGQE
jgi:hypothetical protein